MNIGIILMGVGVVVAIIALLSSKYVRAVCREAIFHPHKHCEIHIHDEGVSIKRIEAKQKSES
jgi:hypothetical protein